MCMIFFFNDTATTEIYTLSLHDALPIFSLVGACACHYHEPTTKIISASGRDCDFHSHLRDGLPNVVFIGKKHCPLRLSVFCSCLVHTVYHFVANLSSAKGLFPRGIREIEGRKWEEKVNLRQKSKT